MKKYLKLIPFAIVCLLVCYTWFIILTTNKVASWKHNAALAIVSINLVLYFIRFSFGLLITGVLLLLATFNIISLLPETASTSYFIVIAGKEISTPPFQGSSLLLFVLYLFLTWNHFREYFDSKRTKRQNP